jgi:hypothetical protein
MDEKEVTGKEEKGRENNNKPLKIWAAECSSKWAALEC